MKRQYAVLSMCAIVVLLTACIVPFLQQGPSGEPPAVPPSGGAIPASTDPNLVPLDLGGGPPAGTPMVWWDGSILVFVPGSEFIMGGEGSDNPEHKVGLSSFWIYRTKVTNRMYTLCVANGKCDLPKDQQAVKDYNDPLLRDVPVVGVDWQQSDAYCKFVEGRLPTEAEWEKTARGPDGNVYPWGNAEPVCGLLNYNGSCVGKTSKVFDYIPGKSFYTALDMEGNVFEWNSDWYDPNYYKSAPVVNPAGPEIGTVRSVRSSSFQSDATQIPAYRRFYLDPLTFRPDLGFRCVIENPHPFLPICGQMFIPGKIGDEPIGGQLIDYSNCPVPSVGLDSIKCVNPNTDPQTASISGDAIVGEIDTGSVSGGAMTCTTSVSSFVCIGPDDQTVSGKVCAECEESKEPDGNSCLGSYYDAVTDACIENGQPGECPPGYALDPVNQCCSAGPGIPAIGCAPDEALVDGECVLGSSQTNSPCNTFNFSVSECTPPPTKTPNVPPPPQGCQDPGQYTDSSACKRAGCTWVITTQNPNGFCN